MCFLNFILLGGHICMTHINHCFQVLLIAFKSLSRMQPWRTKIFLQVSELLAHHSYVLPPELELTQVIKGLISSRNCPWLKTHLQKNKLPVQRKETAFCTHKIYFCTDLWRGPVLVLAMDFHFLKKPHDCETSSTTPIRNNFPLLACSCVLNVPQVCPAAIQGSSVSLFCWVRLFSKSLSCCQFWKTFGNLNWKLLISPRD